MNAAERAVTREIEWLRGLATADAPAVLETLLEHSPHGILVCDLDGKLTLHNRAAESIWAGRVAADTCADWSRFRAFHPDGRPYAPSDWALARCLARREVIPTAEVEIERFDGTRAVLLCSAAPIVGADGVLRGALAVFADVTRLHALDTERIRLYGAEQRARRQLAENERRLQQITDAVPALVSFVDRDGRYQFVNSAHERWFGRPKEELLGKTVAEVVGPDAYARIRPHAEAALAGTPVTFDGRVPYRDGGARYIEASYVPHRGPDGVAGYVALVADVSERRQLHEENARARIRAEQLYRFAQAVVTAERVEEVFEAALEAIEHALGAGRAAVLIFDRDGALRFRAWRRLSPRYRAEVEGHSPWPRDAVAPAPIIVPDVRTDPAMAAYLPVLEAEGIGALGFFPLVSRGRLVGKFVVYFDAPHAFSPQDVEMATAIGNHLASVSARFAATAELEATLHLNELFAGVLAHDLRNPLGAIMTAAQLLLRRQEHEDERATRPLHRIVASGDRMARMIEQLLDFTRLRVGSGLELQPHEEHLGELCAQAVSEIELAHPDWRIRQVAEGDLRGTWDPDRLLQIISNLVSNAGGHGTPGGEVQVHLDGRQLDRIRIEVHNAGVIPEAVLGSLFDPFRGTQHRRTKSRGLGLGLFIVKEIAVAHGGTIDLTSTESSGTTFEVHLPRHAPKSRARR